MKTITNLLLLIALLLPSTSFAAQCAGSNEITDPELFNWTWEGDHYSRFGGAK